MGKDQLPQNQSDGEMTKVGVACSCHAGGRPLDTEMTKVASGAFQCQKCGKMWGQPPVEKKGS